MGGSPRQHGNMPAGPSRLQQQSRADDASSSEGDSQQHNDPAASSASASGDHSSSSADSAEPAGSEVVVQSGERVDLPPFGDKLDKPMMEMVAGSNIWYQAHVLQSNKTKLRVLFPAPTEGKKDKKEWVLRTSSRIWRGPMSTRDWKYLSKGAWSPRVSKSARRKAGRKGGRSVLSGKRGRGGALASGADATASAGTGGALGSEVDSGRGAPGEEPDVASPRKQIRRAKSVGGTPVSSGSGATDDGHMGTAFQRHDSGGSAGLPRAAAARKQRQGPSVDRQCEARGIKDPLAAWFVHHFMLLDKAGLLGDNFDNCSPEAGFLPPLRPAPGNNTARQNPSGILPEPGGDSKPPGGAVHGLALRQASPNKTAQATVTPHGARGGGGKHTSGADGRADGFRDGASGSTGRLQTQLPSSPSGVSTKLGQLRSEQHK